MMQSAYLCVILYVKHQKVTASAVLTWFLEFLVKSKMEDIVDDVTGLQ